MIKKTILICTFALLASVSASARSLVLVLNDSTKIYFLLNDKPVLRMADGKVQIDTQSFLFEDIDRFYISQTDDPSGKAERLQEFLSSFRRQDALPFPEPCLQQ